MRRFALLLLPVLLGRLPDGLRRSQQQHRVVRRQGLRVLRRQAEGHRDQGRQAGQEAGCRRARRRATGPKVAKGDLLVADYLGQVYKSGKVFDNSYDRKVAGGVPDRHRRVIPGWDKALVGVKAGSRVLMVRAARRTATARRATPRPASRAPTR